MPKFGAPLMSARARRATFLECQNSWDRQVALEAGYAGHTNHLTLFLNGVAEEYVVIKSGPEAGKKLRYPADLEAELHKAKEWARNKASRIPAISS